MYQRALYDRISLLPPSALPHLWSGMYVFSLSPPPRRYQELKKSLLMIDRLLTTQQFFSLIQHNKKEKKIGGERAVYCSPVVSFSF